MVLQSAVSASRPSDHKPDSNVEDDDGYSSFDDEDAAKTPTSKKETKAKNKREQPADEDSDGDASGDGDDEAGPERTTPCESKESKEFLHAVFRADKSRIRELLDSGDVDANTADQVRQRRLSLTLAGVTYAL